MNNNNQDSVTAARLSLFAPLAVLAALYIGLTVIVMMYDRLAVHLKPVNLAVAAVAYGAALALLIKYGMRNFRNLEQLGLTDSLSGVPNRRALHIDARRLGSENQEQAIALIDLDGFKQVNDHYGHAIGDRVIRECANLLKEVCGQDGRYYRLGGDEFAILVVGPVAGTILEGICRRLLERLREPVHVDDRAIMIGASAGLSTSQGRADIESSELLRRSDVAMYASKAAGKARCTWFVREFDNKRENAQQIDAELRAALANEEFRMHYQPLVDSAGGTIVAVEALLRWERPDGRKIGPDVFIPIAEETGLINAIGLWVLRRSCSESLEWSDVKLSVNISASQLRNPEFPIQLGEILEETGFPPSRLELEVTETYMMHDPAQAQRSLEVIRGFGVGVVLDDFGTGYASIGFLRKLRFEKLKLDRSLVMDAESDEGSRAMILSIIAVARAMDMQVTAEGVETEDQASLVRAAGCDQMQGWLYFKAMPADAVGQFIAQAMPGGVSDGLTYRGGQRRLLVGNGG